MHQGGDPEFSQIIPCGMSESSRNFHKNALLFFSVRLLTGTNPQESCIEVLMLNIPEMYPEHFVKISWYFFSETLMNKHSPIHHRQNNLHPGGDPRTTSIYQHILCYVYNVRSILKFFWKSGYAFFPLCCKQRTLTGNSEAIYMIMCILYAVWPRLAECYFHIQCEAFGLSSVCLSSLIPWLIYPLKNVIHPEFHHDLCYES